MTMPETKRCTGCKNVRKRKFFSLKRTSPDGLQAQCKFCNADEYRARKRAKVAQVGGA